MVKKLMFVPAFAFLTAATFFGLAMAAQQLPNLSGTYRCGPDAKLCQNSGTTFTVTQKGAALEAKNERNEMGTGTVTSNISVSMGPPWNMLGTFSDGKQIEWSNGTQWKKQ